MVYKVILSIESVDEILEGDVTVPCTQTKLNSA